jgi:hypothetical protein
MHFSLEAPRLESNEEVWFPVHRWRRLPGTFLSRRRAPKAAGGLLWLPAGRQRWNKHGIGPPPRFPLASVIESTFHVLSFLPPHLSPPISETFDAVGDAIAIAGNNHVMKKCNRHVVLF